MFYVKNSKFLLQHSALLTFLTPDAVGERDTIGVKWRGN